MMEVIFRKEAEADLRSIIAYYEDLAPQSLDSILSDIYRSIDQLTFFPRLGMPVKNRRFRRIVTLRYHFKIAYEVGKERIAILGIFRYQDRET
jgi:plasmid stabilization system protein ParE